MPCHLTYFPLYICQDSSFYEFVRVLYLQKSLYKSSNVLFIISIGGGSSDNGSSLEKSNPLNKNDESSSAKTEVEKRMIEDKNPDNISFLYGILSVCFINGY